MRIDDQSFIPPTDDPFIRQELIETLYHVLWELVHVFLEHREAVARSGAGAASFLYPFLDGGSTDLDAVREDVRRSIEAKALEIGALREQTLRENADVLEARRRGRSRRRAAARARQRRLGDRRDGRRRRLRAPAGGAALDLTDDPAVLTAIANDIGVEAIFSRQVIAHGRPGDTLLTLSTRARRRT